MASDWQGRLDLHQGPLASEASVLRAERRPNRSLALALRFERSSPALQTGAIARLAREASSLVPRRRTCEDRTTGKKPRALDESATHGVDPRVATGCGVPRLRMLPCASQSAPAASRGAVMPMRAPGADDREQALSGNVCAMKVCLIENAKRADGSGLGESCKARTLRRTHGERFNAALPSRAFALTGCFQWHRNMAPAGCPTATMLCDAVSRPRERRN